MNNRAKRSTSLVSYISAAGWSIVLTAVALNIISGIMPAVYIQIYTRFVDGIISGIETNSIGAELLYLLPAFLVFGFINYFSGSVTKYFSTRLKIKLSITLRLAQIEKISNLSYYHIENKDSYKLIKRIRNGMPDEFVNGFFSWLSLIALILRILAIAWSVLRLEPWLAGLLVILFIPMILISLKTGKQDYDAFNRFTEVMRRLDDYEKVLSSKEFVNERTIFGFHPWLIRKWQNGYDDAGKQLMAIRKQSYIGIKTSSMVITISGLMMILSLVFGVRSGSVTIGGFSAISAELLMLSSNLSWSLSSALMGISRCREYMRDVHKYEELSETDLSGGDVKEAVQEIRFNNVSFCYPGSDKYVLKSLNLVIDTTKSYAVVGKNGAGKTTLTKLLLGLYPEYDGEILLDGIELRQISDKSKIFSVAFQDFAKYQVSLRENITLGDSGKISDTEIAQLMKNLQFPLDEEHFPNGLDTPIGYMTDKNTNLSIGQWQKIALIRAIAHGGSFFLLDEPTASLDPSAENEVYNNFLSVIQNKPSLIITHRLGAARLADNIVVIDDGRVAEQGSHDDLIAANGLYAEMFETQKGWYG